MGKGSGTPGDVATLVMPPDFSKLLAKRLGCEVPHERPPTPMNQTEKR